VLRSLPCDQLVWTTHNSNGDHTGWMLPQAQSADGDAWSVGISRTDPPNWETVWVIVRITASGVRRYPCALANLNMARDSKGDIWALGFGGNYRLGTGRIEGCRYDAKADAFVKGDPLEAFAVCVANKKFSCVLNGSPPYCKSEDGWHPFVSPFGPASVYVNDGAFRGDCVLMRIDGVGVMEYNAKLDKWIRLIDCSGNLAAYDSRGRRIIAGSYFVLAYEGDPWAGVQADTAGQADTDGQATFDSVLKQMGDSSEKVREDATKAMAAAFDKFHKRIITASDDASLSAEVRTRLKSILSNTFLTPPPALFRTMHPVLTSAK
jgi:hypothetical protein